MEKLDQLKQITGNDKVPIEDIYKELYRSSIDLCSCIYVSQGEVYYTYIDGKIVKKTV